MHCSQLRVCQSYLPHFLLYDRDMMIYFMRLCSCIGVMIALLLSMSTVSASTVEVSTFRDQLSRYAVSAPADMGLPELQRFYSARGYQPVWTQSDQSLASLDVALAFIQAIDAEGLDSSDYQLQELRQLQSRTQHNSDTLFELELRTTQALLKLTRDLRSGHLIASKVDPDWHLPHEPFDPVAFLLTAVASDKLQNSLISLSPEIPDYQLMKQALARYRELVAKQWTRTIIPHAPSIRPNTDHAVIPLIRKRILEAYAIHGTSAYNVLQQGVHFDDVLVNAIKVFQAQHGLNADGIIGKNTRRALNLTPEGKIQQLRLNMERLRWLPRNLGERYLLVNIAGFRLVAVKHGKQVLNMRIIVGRDYRATPSFSSQMTRMILNPFWNIPASIARKDLLPKQQNESTFFTTQGIKVFPDYDVNSEPLDPDTIDWHAIKKGFPYRLRQDPGVKNALGTIKFMFPNPFSIYLHDTPSKSLFQKDIRTFSSGCIRLENPMELVGFALNETQSVAALTAQIRDGKTSRVNLPAPLPIYIVYLTTWIDDQNKIHYSPDIYGRDRRVLNFTRW